MEEYWIRVNNGKDAYVLYGILKDDYVIGKVLTILDKDISKFLIHIDPVNYDFNYNLDKSFFRKPENWEIVKFKLMRRS